MPGEAIAGRASKVVMSQPKGERGHPLRARLLPRTNLWLVPTISVFIALAVFVVAQALDRAHHARLIHLPEWLDQGSAADARDLLSATAGAIITTLGLVLSITVLTLSIAASQFGQRMLRRYMRDGGTQIAIGVFAATFIFSLLTLLSVRSHPGEREFVPWLSAWLSTLLALACLCVLIFFIHHVAQSIQVHHVIAGIAADLRRVALELFTPSHAPHTSVAEGGRPSLDFLSPKTGFLRHVDHTRLVPAVADASMVVHFLKRPGEFVLSGTPLATLTVDAVDTDRGRLPAPLARVLAKSVSIGPDRTLRQDPEFAIEQLVEIALRAMSPAINDPMTMFVCAYWLGDCLRVLAGVPSPHRVHSDRDGRARVLVPTASFTDFVRTGFDPLRWVVKASPMASVHLLETIEKLAPHVPPADRTELWKQADQVREGLSEPVGAADRAAVDAAYQRAADALREH